MKRIALITLVAILPGFGHAQDADPNGRSQMEKGAQLFLEGMMEEMAPALEGFAGLAEKLRPALRDFAKQMGPALGDILDKVESWDAYEPPKILPNGDIIIKRKPKSEPDVQPDQPPVIFLDENPQIEI